MKYLIHSVLLMIILSFALSSCNNDDNTPTDETTKYTWYFGYFKGNLNEQSVEIINKDNNQDWNKITCTTKDIYPTIGIYAYDFFITLKNNSFLGIGLRPFKKGIQYSHGYPQYDSTAVHIRTDNKLYYPLKTPFKIQVDSIFYVNSVRNSSLPFVIGKLNGILYNKDNLNDSIIVKNASFGIHG